MRGQKCLVQCIGVTSLIALAGCSHCAPGCGPCEERTTLFPRLGLFRPRTTTPPPPAVPVVPAAPQPLQSYPPPAPPPNPTPDIRGYAPPNIDQTWHAPYQANPLAPNAPIPGTGSQDGVRLLRPEPPLTPVPETPKASVTEQRSPAPGAGEGRRQPSLPEGIPQFAAVRDQVSSGLKPGLEGGLDWLRDNNYRTVLHVRLPNADDSADRREVEKRNLRYLSLEVSPATLNADIVKKFATIVGDPKNYPLFVYDRDGALAGGLWYLFFRQVDHDSDAVARLRASRLGLKENGEGDALAMWLAVQKLLSEEKK